MPAQRPRASFEPIPPDFDLRELVESTDNFQYVDRISCDTIEEQGLENFEKLILLHVIIGGKPLVVDGFEDRLDPWTFTPKWLQDNHGEKGRRNCFVLHKLTANPNQVENARNLASKDNLPLTIGHYLNNIGKLTDQYFDKPDNYKDKARQRMYLKDIDCPPVWQEKLKEHIPASLFYWNDSTGEPGGPGAVNEPIPNGAGHRKGKGIASAGDLMSSLPVDMRAENLMCYIGHEGTYTPAHREMCASLGQNIMVNASEAFDENGRPEKPGSSIWFMTESKDRHTVAEYWLSVLGHDIEVENHFAQVVAWQRAPFKVYVVEQKAGDFILIPPLAPHQVWNRGTRTMKVAWNRTTVETLELAMEEALPNARMVCRDEQYKNKAIVYYTLLKYSGLLESARMQSSRSLADADAIYASKKVRQVQKDFKRLFELYKNILLSESFAPSTKETCDFIAYDSNVTCAYCRGNIFNRFLTCKTCMDMLNTGTDEPYDVCMDCFAMGRSCACQSKYKWAEQFKWKDLVARYEEWRRQVIQIDGGITENSPRTLELERERYVKKTIAQVCQEQLKKRPWIDIKQSPPVDDDKSEEEIQINDDGTVKKAVKKRSKSWYDSNKTCHVCCGRHPAWMMAICTMCERGWCYGSLWRAHDLMPQDVMVDPNWECPHCLKVCSTGACRKDKRQTPYEPKGTLLGHDTKKVADVRSVEALVDFSVSNLNWIRESAKTAPTESARLQRKREEAERAKLNDPILDERYVDGDEDEGIVLDGDDRAEIEYSPVDDMIDPALGGGSSAAWRPDNEFQGSAVIATGHSFSGDHTLNTSAEEIYPDPSYNLNGEYVVPSAVMYNTFDNSPNSTMNSLIDGESTPAQKTKKRGRQEGEEQIKLVTSKKRKVTQEERPVPKNKASKQYQIVQENKRLEEARKAGRYIQVLAAIRKRKRIIILNVPKDKLAIFAQQDSSKAVKKANHPSAQNVVLQSDVAQPKTGPTMLSSARQNKKAANHFRVRVEDDEDFLSRDRSGPKKPSKPQYEEIVVDSDSDEETGQDGRPNQKKDGRRSSWLSRKNQDEENLPDELPANFKDRHPRKRDTNRRTTVRTQPQAQKAPRLQPRASTGSIGTNGAPNAAQNTSLARKRGRPPATVKPSPAQPAIEQVKAAILEEDNRRAKLEAAGLSRDGDSTSSSSEDEPTAPTKGGPADGFDKPTRGRSAGRPNEGSTHATAPARKSMFSGPGMLGIKIKIVGASDPKATANSSGLTAISPRMTRKDEVQTSHEDSSSTDGEIPAKLPPKKSRPASRTSLPKKVGGR
jgi:hypothetical protein